MGWVCAWFDGGREQGGGRCCGREGPQTHLLLKGGDLEKTVVIGIPKALALDRPELLDVAQGEIHREEALDLLPVDSAVGFPARSIVRRRAQGNAENAIRRLGQSKAFVSKRIGPGCWVGRTQAQSRVRCGAWVGAMDCLTYRRIPCAPPRPWCHRGSRRACIWACHPW